MAGRAAKYQILARARWKKQPLAALNGHAPGSGLSVPRRLPETTWCGSASAGPVKADVRAYPPPIRKRPTRMLAIQRRDGAPNRPRAPPPPPPRDPPPKVFAVPG